MPIKIAFLILAFVFRMNCLTAVDFVFKHISTDDGLSNNFVNCILQDKKGFLWFGTENGLNRYDGYSFKVFQSEGNDYGLSNNQVRAMAEDNQGRLWIGTNNGLNCFDPVSETFQHFFYIENDTTTISNNRITSLYYSSDDILWVGTENGLNKFDPSSFTNIQLTRHLKKSTQAVDIYVTTIAEDADGYIWFGMWWGGLKRINPKTLHVTDYFADPAIKHGLSNDNVLSIFCDSSNTIWITCYKGEIARFNYNTEEFLPVADMENILDLGVINQDKNGHFWLRSTPGTLIVYNPDIQRKRILMNRQTDPSTISTGAIQDIFFDRTGIAWIATDKGISYYDPRGQMFSQYYHQLNIGKRDFCATFYQDKNQQVWISVYDVGLVKYNPTTKTAKVFPTGTNNPKSVNHVIINGIQADNDGKIWLATNNGICIVDPKTDLVTDRLYYIDENSPAILNTIFSRSSGSCSRYFWLVEGGVLDVKNQKIWRLFDHGEMQMSDLNINCIVKDRNGDLWLGSDFSGLKHFRIPTMQLTNFVNKPEDPNSICSNTINDIMEDKTGNIWFATPNGLSRFDPEKNLFLTFTKKEGLSSNECFSVKEDSRGNVWILNSNGLDKMDPETGSVTRFGKADGLSLNLSGLYQNDKGYIFGGHSENGFYLFHPDSIPIIESKQKVYITNFLIFNEPVHPGRDKTQTPLVESVLETKEVVLNHKQTVFSFEFSSLNYADRWKSRYAYKLEGFNNKWFYTDENNRRITYTNLNPGTYVFNVRVASGDDRNSSDTTTLKVTILPPPWKTWWAYTLYLITFLFLLNFIRKHLADKHKFKHEIAIQRIANAKTEEIAQIKQRFFINISHEFRTPLTLIGGPVENLIRNIDITDKLKILENLHLVKRNSERLSELTNQLLDIRKLETGNMKLELALGNLVLYVKNIAQGFESLAHKKQIKFIVQSNGINELLELHWFDPDKILKIISNLLSNAFKFTPEHGEISVTIEPEFSENAVSRESNHVDNNQCSFIKVTVEDSGIGIKKEDQAKIFERFFQVENPKNNTIQGTGIGLALTKELVLLHGGTVDVVSQKGKGSRFTVVISIDKEKLSNFIIIESDRILDHSNPQIEPTTSLDVPIDSPTIDGLNESLPLILLVEDNADIRTFLRNILESKYRIEEAENGSQGLVKALNNLPDLIVSDVMMPEMDGFQFTNIIKTDERTSHVPVILLTSLASIDNVIKGLEYDADEYITKPFNDQILLLKVQNIIQSRQKLKLKYLQHVESGTQKSEAIEIEPAKIEIPDAEQIFLDKLMAVMEKYMDESNFGVQQFSSEIGMEASVLHRKLKALIDQSPGEFIRSMRMKRAAQLLSNKSIAIGEVAYMIGFGNNTNYFSTAFRKHFGKTPKEFQNS